MANKNYIGHEYFCSVCKTFIIAKESNLDYIHLKHDSGEELEVVTLECDFCKSMSIPEGMNQIAWLKEGMDFI